MLRMEQHDTPILGVQPVHQAGLGRLECYFRAWRVRVFIQRALHVCP